MTGRASISTWTTIPSKAGSEPETLAEGTGDRRQAMPPAAMGSISHPDTLKKFDGPHHFSGPFSLLNRRRGGQNFFRSHFCLLS